MSDPRGDGPRDSQGVAERLYRATGIALPRRDTHLLAILAVLIGGIPILTAVAFLAPALFAATAISLLALIGVLALLRRRRFSGSGRQPRR